MHPALTLLSLLAAAPAPGGFDVILANGRVVDGTGAPWFRADVGIRGDRIAAVGELSKAAAVRRVDVAGKMVAPGFIDMLGQSEISILIDDRAESKIRQGVTTEISGEGRSPAPLDDTLLGEARPFLEKFKVAIDWRDVAGYGARLRRTPPALNMGILVGATTARVMVLGMGAAQPTPAQFEKMVGIADRALSQGALGVGSSLIYPPATAAQTSELVALARAAARHGGFYATHLRNEADDELAALDEAIAIGREAKVPVEIWHLKVAGKNNWGRMKELIARIERARAEGVDVSANVYPYAAAMNGLMSNVPAWAQEGGTEKMLARFKDPKTRERIKAGLWRGGLGLESPEDIQLSVSVEPSLSPYLGRRLSEVAKELGKSPEDTLLDLLAASRGRIGVIRFVMHEDDLQLALRQPWVSMCSDGPAQGTDGPFGKDRSHPRSFGSAARVLGHYARDLKLFSQEEAVRKMTSLPARRAGLWDRGLVRPGMAADLVVFDPAVVRDLATYDEPSRYSEGVDTVLVNGAIVLDGGKLTKARPGRLLTRR